MKISFFTWVILSTALIPTGIYNMNRLTRLRNIKNNALPGEFRQSAADGNIVEMNNIAAEVGYIVGYINEDIGEFEDLLNIVYQQDKNGRTPLFHCACYAQHNIRKTKESGAFTIIKVAWYTL